MSQLVKLINDLKQSAYVVGGCPTYWRQGINDSLEGYHDVYRMFDCLSPWTVGRYVHRTEVADYYQTLFKEDVAFCEENNICIAPVAWPGFSEMNLKRTEGSCNVVPRQAGAFLWEQFRASVNFNPLFVYIAMFDELDEGTAIFKVSERSVILDRGPVHPDVPNQFYRFLGLDADGVSLPSDWYMRIVGKFTQCFSEMCIAPDKESSLNHLHEIQGIDMPERVRLYLKGLIEQQNLEYDRARQEVRECYRKILMREGDPEGVSYYTQCLLRGVVISQIEQWMYDSPERKLLEFRRSRRIVEEQNFARPHEGVLSYVLPRPAVAKCLPGVGLSFSKATKIVIAESLGGSIESSEDQLLTVYEAASTGSSLLGGLEICENEAPDAKGAIYFLPIQEFEMKKLPASEECYILKVYNNRCEIHGRSGMSYLYGLVTLLQMLLALRGPEEAALKIERMEDNEFLELPALEIYDAPEFTWRGTMLDSSRHFLPVDFVFKHIDAMLLYKLNRLHWHLTDDQAWRLEIRAFPELVHQAPLYLQPSPDKRGYYTQEEVQSLVRYARCRGILVIPEIELPGHSLALLTAYPQYCCLEKPLEAVGARWGVHEDVFCIGGMEWISFMEKILDEVFDLFPGSFIHVGGDEVPHTRWNHCPKCQRLIKEMKLNGANGLKQYGMHKLLELIERRGRIPIGWDEILDDFENLWGIRDRMMVQAWRGRAAVEKSIMHDCLTISSPTEHCYFDYDISITDLRSVHCFQPNPLIENLPSEEACHLYKKFPRYCLDGTRRSVVGAECAMWTEFTALPMDVEQKLWPRTLAFAEVVWSGGVGHSSCMGGQRWESFEDFFARAKLHIQGLKNSFVVGSSFPAGWSECGLPPDLNSIVPCIPGAKICSSLDPYKHHHLPFAIDGNPETYFWSNRGVQEGDEILVTFDRPVTDCIVVVVRTGYFGRDILYHAVLEYMSTEDSCFQPGPSFVHGSACLIVPNKCPLTAIRVRATGSQEEWLIVSEITCETVMWERSRWSSEVAVTSVSSLPLQEPLRL